MRTMVSNARPKGEKRKWDNQVKQFRDIRYTDSDKIGLAYSNYKSRWSTINAVISAGLQLPPKFYLQIYLHAYMYLRQTSPLFPSVYVLSVELLVIESLWNTRQEACTIIGSLQRLQNNNHQFMIIICFAAKFRHHVNYKFKQIMHTLFCDWFEKSAWRQC